MKSIIVFILCAGLLGCGGKGSTSSAGTAASQIRIDEKNFADLMTNFRSGVVEPQPWVGYWWPYVGSGIASTWRDDKGMSPADKYDVAYISYLKNRGISGSIAESAAAWERAKHGPGLASVASWWGHCNGWAASSVMVAEPKEPKTIEGVPFGVRDLKALLAESWMEFSGDFVGTRVNDSNDFSSAAFWDIVPAQFHLLLSNLVGRQKRGIILDRHTGAEIWNQPLVAYQFEPTRREDYLGAHPDYPDVYRVNVIARIWWANDNVAPDDVTPTFDIDRELTDNKARDYSGTEYFPSRRLRYQLWLDAPVEFDSDGHLIRSGRILVTEHDGRYVGGVWMNGSDPAYLIHTHPDYMWMPFGVQTSIGYKNPRIDDTWIRDNIGRPEHQGGLGN